MQIQREKINFSDKKQSEQVLKTIIRDCSLKVTNQRIAILQIILSGRTHVTAQEVFENVMILNPEIGFATVYRFLRSLCENSFMTEVRIGGHPARYEWSNKEHHDHLTCTQCRKILEFENDEIEKLQISVAEKYGFKLTNHVLELYGVCKQCQNIPSVLNN